MDSAWRPTCILCAHVECNFLLFVLVKDLSSRSCIEEWIIFLFCQISCLLSNLLIVAWLHSNWWCCQLSSYHFCVNMGLCITEWEISSVAEQPVILSDLLGYAFKELHVQTVQIVCHVFTQVMEPRLWVGNTWRSKKIVSSDCCGWSSGRIVDTWWWGWRSLPNLPLTYHCC